MNNIKLKQIIIDVLKSDDRLWNEDKTELNQTLLLDLVENIDEKLIELLLQEKELRDKFFVKIKDVYVFKTNDFRFFIEENKVDNSYTQYKNRIGLTDGKRFLKDTNDVVLNWPYKDCVLEGGQSTEEGLDTYFEYDETVTKAQEKQGLKAGTYNKKTAKRKEIFFNSVLAHDEIDRLFDHKALTNWKRFTKDGEQEVGEIKRDEDGTIRENLIIKGNNLLALHSLKKQFAGKIKLIYIDPPYNTGNDGFKYNDNFNHSTWLTFMKNRLEVARDLLRDDGVIFVQCDDNEQAYLKVLMDEVFWRENFVHTVIRITTKRVKGDSKNVNSIHDYIHIYGKRYENVKIFHREQNFEEDSIYNLKDKHISERGKYLLRPLDNGTISYSKSLDYIITAPDGEEIVAGGNPELRKNRLNGNFKSKDWCFRWSKEKFEWGLKNDFIVFKKINNKWRVYFKIYQNVDNKLNKTKKYDNFLSVIENCYNNKGTTEVKRILTKDSFSYPKPESLLYEIIDIFTEPNDIVLDYHLGSGTTAAVAHKMGRQYIGIEQMDYIETIAVERLKKVIAGEQGGISKSVNWQGGGDFIYFELAKWNETAKEKILDCESLEELEAFFDEMYERYFLNYNLKIKEFKEKVLKEENFRNLSLDEQKKIFVAMLDNNQMYVNKTEMADKKFGISEKDQNLTNQFYNS